MLTASTQLWRKGCHVGTDNRRIEPTEEKKRQLWGRCTKVAFSNQTRRYLGSRLWQAFTGTHRIYMHGVFPFRLFDYFVDAVIVRPPLISSIYSPAMPEGHLGKFLQTLSIHQDGRQHDLNLNMSLRQNTNKWRQASSAFQYTWTHTPFNLFYFFWWRTPKKKNLAENDVWLTLWLCFGALFLEPLIDSYSVRIYKWIVIHPEERPLLTNKKKLSTFHPIRTVINHIKSGKLSRNLCSLFLMWTSDSKCHTHQLKQTWYCDKSSLLWLVMSSSDSWECSNNLKEQFIQNWVCQFLFVRPPRH